MDARFSYTGTYSGWLSKIKHEGAKAKWLGSSVRRYFTIDYDYQALAYAHSNDAHSIVQCCVPFRDIISVERPQESWATQVPKGGLKLRRNLSNFYKAQPSVHAEFPLTVHAKCKKFKLIADTDEEAAAWVAGLNAAILIGKGRGDELTDRNKRKPTALSAPGQEMPEVKPPASPAESSSDSTQEGSELGSNSSSRIASNGTDISDVDSESCQMAANSSEALPWWSAERRATILKQEECTERPADKQAEGSGEICRGSSAMQTVSMETVFAIAAEMAATASASSTVRAQSAWQESEKQEPQGDSEPQCADIVTEDINLTLCLRAQDFGFEDGDDEPADESSPVASPLSSPRGSQQAPDLLAERRTAPIRRISPVSSACSPLSTSIAAAVGREVEVVEEGEGNDAVPCKGTSENRKASQARIAADLALVEELVQKRTRIMKGYSSTPSIALAQTAGESDDIARERRPKKEGNMRRSASGARIESVGSASKKGITSEEDKQAARVAADLALLGILAGGA